jgi:hypothetical protein
MIADGVTGCGDFTRQVRLLPDMAPNQEESCSGIVPGQHLQQSEGMSIVRPVIVRQGDLP